MLDEYHNKNELINSPSIFLLQSFAHHYDYKEYILTFLLHHCYNTIIPYHLTLLLLQHHFIIKFICVCNQIIYIYALFVVYVLALFLVHDLSPFSLVYVLPLFNPLIFYILLTIVLFYPLSILTYLCILTIMSYINTMCITCPIGDYPIYSMTLLINLVNNQFIVQLSHVNMHALFIIGTHVYDYSILLLLICPYSCDDYSVIITIGIQLCCNHPLDCINDIHGYMINIIDILYIIYIHFHKNAQHYYNHDYVYDYPLYGYLCMMYVLTHKLALSDYIYLLTKWRLLY